MFFLRRRNYVLHFLESPVKSTVKVDFESTETILHNFIQQQCEAKIYRFTNCMEIIIQDKIRKITYKKDNCETSNVLQSVTCIEMYIMELFLRFY